jgi:L,D-transpeptidase catalytic domain/Ankyrin repeats (3 copies)
MSPDQHAWVCAAALLVVRSAVASEYISNEETAVYEIRRAVMPDPVEDPPTWKNPLPAPEFRAFQDDLTGHLRCTFPDVPRLPVIYQAVIASDVEWLRELLAQGMSPDERTAADDTPLCAAVRLGLPEMVRTLLLAGADPSLPGAYGQPPLALASLRRSTEVTKALLAAGADPETRFASPVDRALLDQVTIKDLRSHLEYDRGVTALMACSARGDVEAVVALMQHGAKTSTCTKKFSRYPINFAATQRYLFLMRVLLGRPPDEEPDTLITIDLSQQRAWLVRNGRTVERTVISTGRDGYDTPAGRYVITDKHRTHTSTLYHVEMPWFMRLNCGAIGLHSGYVTGRPASHGCIRLPHSVARKFFAMTKVGDEVEIVH